MKKEKGTSLMEVVVSAAILGAIAVAFLGTIAAISQFHRKNMLVIKGELLAEEGLEIIRFYKESDWATLAAIPSGESRSFEFVDPGWDIVGVGETIDGIFERQFTVYDVTRDASDDIISGGGIVDPNTRRFKVTVTWAWKSNLVTSEFETYITNI